MPDTAFAHARAGDTAGFAALVRLHQPLVYSIALRMLMDRALAEDLSQEVFLQMYRSLGSIESHEHLAFWLRRVTANRAVDRLRQDRHIEITPLEDAADLFAPTQDDDPLLRKHLHALIQQLAPMARAVVLLRYQEDLDPVEIARTLEIPVNTVKSHLKRSLSTLRQQLAGIAPVSG
ncbi:MAG: sigma-70 family RNA polymerase sigma factor [Gammaproteobacteria bacterium]